MRTAPTEICYLILGDLKHNKQHFLMFPRLALSEGTPNNHLKLGHLSRTTEES